MNFDWVTFGFQLVNVIVLLMILRRFLFRPVADVIARRQAASDAALKAADAAKAEAEAATAQARAEADATVQARHDVLAKAQAEAEAQRKALLDKARAEAAKIVDEGKHAVDRDGEEAQRLALGRARDLAVTIARHAVSAQPAGFAGYAERLAAALAALPARERDALLAGGDLRLVAASPLSADDLAAARSALAPYGVSPEAETDPALIAGLELRSGSGAIRNSLAHDLDRIAETMRDDRTV